MKIPLRSRIHVTEEHDECLRYSRFALSRCWDTLRRGRLRHMVAARMENPKVLNPNKILTIATVLCGASPSSEGFTTTTGEPHDGRIGYRTILVASTGDLNATMAAPVWREVSTPKFTIARQ